MVEISLEEAKKSPWYAVAIVAALCLSAFLLGQSISYIAAIFLQSPPHLTLARREAPRKAVERPVSEIIASTRTLFSQAAAPAARTSPGEKPASTAVSALEGILEGAGSDSSMSLLGTIISPEVYLAFISADDKIYSVHQGEKIGRFTVMRIRKDLVLLVSPDKKITLRMDFTGEKSGASVETQGGTGGGTAGNGEQQVIKKSLSRKDFAAIMDNPDQVAKDILFTPVSRDGKPYGIQISMLGPGSFFKNLDLMPGDILIKTNDKELRTPEDAFLAYQMLRNEDNVNFTVERNGKFIQLNLQFQ
jgi:type II secretion system protein C